MNKEYKYKITKFVDRYQMTINNMTLYDVDEYVVKVVKQIEKENTNLKQALNEIREYINEDNYKDETIWCGDLIPIKKIIDKVLGDDK